MFDYLSNTYTLNSESNVWIRPQFSGIAYNDGDAVERRLATLLKEAQDVSLSSQELRTQCTDWPSLYHLSAIRANILRPFTEILQNKSVLEIGAGCGAITRFLGEIGAEVLALEGSPRRAAIARLRARDLSNVTLVSDRFDAFSSDEPFDIITMIGVLEYAGCFTIGENPAEIMLEQAYRLLKPTGKLIIAIENQLGLKYFAGYPEDHIGQAMYGLEGRYSPSGLQTFGKSSLERMIQQAGFKKHSLYLPFPDYKFAVSILSDAGYHAKDFNAEVFAWQTIKQDPQIPRYHLNFSLERVWPTIFQNHLAQDLSNSFLWVADKAGGATQPIGQILETLAYHYSSIRKPEYCKTTTFQRRANGSIGVYCELLSIPSNTKNHLLSHAPPAEVNYVYGKPLSQTFIDLLSHDGWSIKGLISLIEEYRRFLIKTLEQEQSLSTEHTDSTDDFILPGTFFDIIPQNIIQTIDGEMHIIDREWTLLAPLSFSRLLVRSLTNTLNLMTALGEPEDASIITHGHILQKVLITLGFDSRKEHIKSMLAFEAEIQSEVSGYSPPLEEIYWWLEKPLILRKELLVRPFLPPPPQPKTSIVKRFSRLISRLTKKIFGLLKI